MKLKQKLMTLGLTLAYFASLSLGVLSSFPSNVEAAPGCGYSACSNADIENGAKTLEMVDESTIEATFNGKTVKFTDGKISDSNHTFSAPKGIFCSGGTGVGSVVIDDADYQKINTAGVTVGAVLDVDWYDSAGKKCNDFENTSSSNNLNVVLGTSKLSKVGDTCQSGPGCGTDNKCQDPSKGCSPNEVAGAATTETDPDTCSINSGGFTLAWFMCPMLEAMDFFATKLMNLFESQLSFYINKGSDNKPFSYAADKQDAKDVATLGSS